MAYFKGLVSLRSLVLPDTLVTSECLVHLKGLPKLEELYLTRCRITDPGLSLIAEMGEARNFWVSWESILLMPDCCI